MPAEQALPPKHWESLTAEKKSELMAKGESFIFEECFVYDANPLFTPYELKKGAKTFSPVAHRLLDFKKIVRIDCALIERNRDAPAGIKLLELTIAARSQLRDKLAHFFARIPDEDAA